MAWRATATTSVDFRSGYDAASKAKQVIIDALEEEIRKMNWFTSAQKTEAWVVAEVGKGWAELEAGVKKAEVDIKGLFDYIASHQTQIDQTAQSILGDVSLIAALAGHPEVGAVATTVAASAATITALAANIDKGSVPLSDVVTALHQVKDAQSAVNGLVKVATAKPAKKP